MIALASYGLIAAQLPTNDQTTIQVPEHTTPNSPAPATDNDAGDLIPEDINTGDENDDDEDEQPEVSQPIIHAILVHGNKHISTEAVLNKIPYRVGHVFNPQLTTRLIRTLFTDLNRFSTITVKQEELSNNLINLHIFVQEKYPLKEFTFEGNKQISQKEIIEKLKLDEIPAVDKEELDTIAQKIKRLYREKGYHKISIDTQLDVDASDKALAHFIIKEFPKTQVRRILFTGNKHVSGKNLRNILFTREDWLLSFLDHSGTFQEERLEGDKHAIEQYYQNHGYFNAKVTDVIVEPDTSNSSFTITYEIQEGDLYTIKEVHVPGNELISEEYLLQRLPVQPGQIYSRELIVETIKALEFMWGERGYIFAHIDPSIQPNDDEKTVSLSFYTELGNPITLNKITIKGNKKTRDKVIRRALVLDEGELITNQRMELSKSRVESLGFFDQREGVNWKVNRLDDDKADLDLMVKEAKTGHAGFQLNITGTERTITEPLKGVSLELNLSDTNLFGTGVRTNMTGRFSHEDMSFLFNITQPWLFDRPIFGSFDMYHKRLAYEELHQTRAVNEIDTGGAITTGFVTWLRNYPLFNDTFVRLAVGLDNIKYQEIPTAVISGAQNAMQLILAEQSYNILLQQLFRPNTYGSIIAQIGQDIRNHPMHPSRGFFWLARAVGAFSGSDSCTGFYKFDFDFHWYTPLIGERDLVFHLHSFLGFANPLKGRLIPYRDLFHIGGYSTVRGFLWGQIGPQFGLVNNEGTFLGDSIGASKALYINAEFIFPITPDFGIKALLFYDGGTGWDNPYVATVPAQFIRHNNFNYRHAVGAGLRLLNPMPLRVDWGFKLDPRKGESAHEVHFNMAYDW